MAEAPEGAIGVRLSTPRRGCSGLAYSVDYVTEEQKFDEKIETPGGVFYIDGASVLYLIGSMMDWVEDDFAAGFVFENPNVKGACGCGESFTVYSALFGAKHAMLAPSKKGQHHGSCLLSGLCGAMLRDILRDIPVSYRLRRQSSYRPADSRFRA